MKLRHALSIWIAVFGIAVFLGTPLGSWASHRWGCWKYADAKSVGITEERAITTTFTTKKQKPIRTPGALTRTYS